MHFVARFGRALQAVRPGTQLRLCFSNFQNKILEVIGKHLDPVHGQALDSNEANIKESEFVFQMFKAIAFVPVQLTELALLVM